MPPLEVKSNWQSVPELLSMPAALRTDRSSVRVETEFALQIANSYPEHIATLHFFGPRVIGPAEGFQIS